MEEAIHAGRNWQVRRHGGGGQISRDLQGAYRWLFRQNHDNAHRLCPGFRGNPSGQTQTLRWAEHVAAGHRARCVWADGAGAAPGNGDNFEPIQTGYGAFQLQDRRAARRGSLSMAPMSTMKSPAQRSRIFLPRSSRNSRSARSAWILRSPPSQRFQEFVCKIEIRRGTRPRIERPHFPYRIHVPQSAQPYIDIRLAESLHAV